MKKSTHALIFSGGGANGAYEIGVMKALFGGECPSTGGQRIDPAVFCGTSVGSYNAAAATALWDGNEGMSVVRELERLWLERVAENPDSCSNGVYRLRGDPRRVLDLRCAARNPRIVAGRVLKDSLYVTEEVVRRTVNFTVSSEPLDRRVIESLNLASLVDVAPLWDLVRETVDLDRIRRSSKLLRLAATDWVNGKPKIFTNADMTDEEGHAAIVASCSIPVFFPAVSVGGRHFVDGGVVLNTPLWPAITAGADTLHVIYLDPDVEDIPLGDMQNSMDSLCRMLIIMMAQHLNRDIDLASTYNRAIRSSAGGSRKGKDSQEPLELSAVVDLLHRKAHGGSGAKGLTVHKYRPNEVLSALVGILNFGKARLTELVGCGYRDALAHDCEVSGCVLP